MVWKPTFDINYYINSPLLALNYIALRQYCALCEHKWNKWCKIVVELLELRRVSGVRMRIKNCIKNDARTPQGARMKKTSCAPGASCSH